MQYISYSGVTILLKTHTVEDVAAVLLKTHTVADVAAVEQNWELHSSQDAIPLNDGARTAIANLQW